LNFHKAPKSASHCADYSAKMLLNKTNGKQFLRRREVELSVKLQFKKSLKTEPTHAALNHGVNVQLQ